MASKILANRFLERVSLKGPAWHRLGERFAADKLLLASEVAEKVGGGVEVEGRPLYYLDMGGQYVRAGEYQAIIRKTLPDDPGERMFGVTTERWNSISYVDLARALDELSRTYRVETCGLIEEGSLMFLSLRGPDFSVRGDEMQDYFIVNLSNQPGNAHKILAAPVRVVCYNTNLMALQQATINLAVPHSADAAARINLAATMVAKFRDITTKAREMFEAFAKAPIDAAGMERIFKAAFPDPALPTELRLLQGALATQEQGALREALGHRFADIVRTQDAHDRSRKRVVEIRDAAVARFHEFEPKNLRGTVWAAYNAATEVADWRDGRGADVSSVYGSRAREKTAAFAEAMAVAGMN